jgi:hypothetical protein
MSWIVTACLSCFVDPFALLHFQASLLLPREIPRHV